MKHVKQMALLAVALFILVAQLIIPASAESTVLADLIPSKNTAKGKLTLTGCTMTENSDGSVTFTLTAAEATFKMVFAENVFSEGSGGTIISGDAVNVKNGAFVVYDYASADGVTLTAIAHYTRKDKAAGKTLADLYLNSMEGTDYKQYQKSAGTGYGVWDVGAYITSDKDKKQFDDGLHRFCDLTGSLKGKVGTKLTIYKFYVSSTSDVKDLGKVRPEPTKIESSAASSATSSVASSVATSSVASSIASDSKATSSAKSETASSESKAASSAASSAKSVSSAASDTVPTEESNTLTYVLIGVGAVIVIGVVVFLVAKKKK